MGVVERPDHHWGDDLVKTPAVHKYEQVIATLMSIRTLGSMNPEVGYGTVIFKASGKFEVVELKLEVVERDFEVAER